MLSATKEMDITRSKESYEEICSFCLTAWRRQWKSNILFVGCFPLFVFSFLFDLFLHSIYVFTVNYKDAWHNSNVWY